MVIQNCLGGQNIGQHILLDKDEIVALLRKYILSIEFTKADGTNRFMRCTLMAEHIQPYERKTDGVQTRTITSNPDSITVWDTEAGGFKKVTVSKIKSIVYRNPVESEWDLDEIHS